MNDFVRYLRAKRTVDDRALNGRVWDRLSDELGRLDSDLLEIVDVGAGIGTGVARMSKRALFPAGSSVRYLAVEPRAELEAEARRTLEAVPIEADFIAQDLSDFAASPENEGRFDLVVAHALLDVLDLGASVVELVRLARPGGLLYLPITFDGETIFEPARVDDERILRAYHDTMEERGSSRAGRRLYHALRDPVEVLEMGSSDWIVYPVESRYLYDEAFFLEFIVGTIESALRGRVEAGILEPWVFGRLSQIERGDLFYCAHQLDLLAKKLGSATGDVPRRHRE